MKFKAPLVAACAAALLAACAPAIGHVPAVGDSVQQITHTTKDSAAPSPITRWYHAVAPKISDVEQSITWAQWTARRADHRGLARACHEVRHATHVAQRARHAPDRIVAHRVSRELRSFDRAATFCLARRFDDSADAVNYGHHWAYLADRRILRLVHAAD